MKTDEKKQEEDIEIDNTKDKPSQKIKNKTRIKWRKPGRGVMKLNFDGSSSNLDGSTTGYIIRDSEGKHITLGYKHIGKQSPLMAEALSLREGVIKAREL